MIKQCFSINESTPVDILNHFSLCEPSIFTNLEKKVNVHEYIQKIFHKADRYEIWKGNTMIAFIAIYTNRGPQFPAYISNVSVIENETSKGNGGRLMDFLIHDLKEKNFNSIELEVLKNNNKAISLYKSKGAIITSDNASDSYLMTIFLSNHLS